MSLNLILKLTNSTMSFLLVFIITFSLASSPAAASEIVDQVCKNAIDPAFCHDIFHFDPQAPTVDEYMLNYMAVGLASRNASNTSSFIESKLKKAIDVDKLKPWCFRNRKTCVALKKCRVYYRKAARLLIAAQSALDSESFGELEPLELEVDRSVRRCEASFGGKRNLMSKRNGDLIKLVNICLVASKLNP